jgi:hypothetical protein
MNTKNNRKVISRRNAGFGDNLFAAAHAWYYAQKTNRSLVVNWAPSMYLDDKGKNAFGYFFDFPDHIKGVPIIAKDRVNMFQRQIRSLPVTPAYLFIPAMIAEIVNRILKNKSPEYFKNILKNREKWISDIIRHGKDVKSKTLIFNGVYGFLEEETKPFFNELKLKSKYQQKVEDFAAENFKNKVVIGVHIRYYDKSLPKNNHTKYWLEPEKSLIIINDNLKKILSELKESNYVVFLATDNKMVHDSIKGAIDNVITFEKNFDIVQKGMHLELPIESAFNGLVEMFLLAKSDILYRFPPSGSWFSHYGSIYAKKVI